MPKKNIPAIQNLPSSSDEEILEASSLKKRKLPSRSAKEQARTQIKKQAEAILMEMGGDTKNDTDDSNAPKGKKPTPSTRGTKRKAKTLKKKQSSSSEAETGTETESKSKSETEEETPKKKKCNAGFSKKSPSKASASQNLTTKIEEEENILPNKISKKNNPQIQKEQREINQLYKKHLKKIQDKTPAQLVQIYEKLSTYCIHPFLRVNGEIPHGTIVDAHINTQLHWAVVCKQHKEAKRLLEEHGPAYANYCSSTHSYSRLKPLHIAASYGDSSMIQLLLEHGADPNSIHYRTLQTPFYVALTKGHQKITLDLLEKTTLIHIPEKFGGRTPLMHAASNNNWIICWALLDKEPYKSFLMHPDEKSAQIRSELNGMRTNPKFKKNKTPFQKTWVATLDALYSNHLRNKTASEIKSLLTHTTPLTPQASLQTQHTSAVLDEAGSTSLEEKSLSEEAGSLLSGAQEKMPSPHNNTPLFQSYSLHVTESWSSDVRNAEKERINKLREQIISSAKKQKLLDSLYQKGINGCVDLLQGYERKVDIQVCSEGYWAAACNQLIALRKILPGIPNVNLKNNYRETMLSIATRLGHVDIVEELRKADEILIDMYCGRRLTIIHTAIRYERPVIAKMLLDKTDRVKCGPTLKSKTDRPTLTLAVNEGYEEVVNTLLTKKPYAYFVAAKKELGITINYYTLKNQSSRTLLKEIEAYYVNPSLIRTLPQTLHTAHSSTSSSTRKKSTQKKTSAPTSSISKPILPPENKEEAPIHLKETARHSTSYASFTAQLSSSSSSTSKHAAASSESTQPTPAESIQNTAEKPAHIAKFLDTTGFFADAFANTNLFNPEEKPDAELTGALMYEVSGNTGKISNADFQSAAGYDFEESEEWWEEATAGPNKTP